MQFPSAIIFVNSDINDISKTKMETQLYIHQTMTKSEFDYLIQHDPSYINQVNLNNLRVLVIGDFFDLSNRNFFDVVMYFAHGIINIEYNKFGPPIPSISLENLDIYALLRMAKSNKVTILPTKCKKCNKCNCGAPFYKPYDPSGVYCSDESHYTNQAWLDRDK